MRFVWGVIVTILIIIVGGFAIIFSGVLNVAATYEDNAVVAWILHKTFMRSVPEVVLQVNAGRPVVIRTDINGYPQLERTLRRRLAPDLQARWKEARDS